MNWSDEKLILNGLDPAKVKKAARLAEKLGAAANDAGLLTFGSSGSGYLWRGKGNGGEWFVYSISNGFWDGGDAEHGHDGGDTPLEPEPEEEDY